VYDLRDSNNNIEFGSVPWRSHILTKIAKSLPWEDIDPGECDVWGLTANFHIEREIIQMLCKHLGSTGKPVVVGGSDAFVDPTAYINAGATVVVMDKSGGSNQAAIDIACGSGTDYPYMLYTKDGYIKNGRPRLHPENWRLPDLSFVDISLGRTNWRKPFTPDSDFPTSELILDHGCDRACSFCATPLYGLGYQYMTPGRVREWLERQKEAGANSIGVMSDQFLARVLYPEKGDVPSGRTQLLQIVDHLRDLKLNWSFNNGIEIRKLTHGRGFKGGDCTVDMELMEALCGRSDGLGCASIYIPAERPLQGTDRHEKLLQWSDHVEMVKAIVRAGVPNITYSVIIGYPEETDESLAHLMDVMRELKEEIMSINPELNMVVNPNSFIPFPGTPERVSLVAEGLLSQDADPVLVNSWTPTYRTRALTGEELTEWQRKLFIEFSHKGRRGMTAYDE